MNIYLKHYLLISLFFTIIIWNGKNAHAQEINSSFNACLQEAESIFRKGNPETVIEKLKVCLEDPNALKADLINAYRLLTLAYLEDEQTTEAEKTFTKLLKEDPEFDISKLPPQDADLLDPLYQSFQTEPIFYIRAEAGANFSNAEALQSFGASNTDALISANASTYLRGSGFQAAMNFGIPLLNRNIRLNTGLIFLNRTYNYENALQTSTTDSLNFATLSLTESQNLFQIPLMLSIDFDKWNTPNYQKSILVPFMYGGLSMEYMISSRMTNISRINTIGASQNGLSNASISDLRRKQNYNLIIGGGLKYKVGKSHIVLNVRYTQGINNLVDAQKRYSNHELLYLFGHVDDDFSMNTLSISIGVESAFYKPRKRK